MKKQELWQLSPFRECSAQMAVELAVLMPVIIAVALLVFNVMRYAELCVRFDRMAPDIVLAYGVSPAGSSSELGASSTVQAALEDAMDEFSCDISVSVEKNTSAGNGVLLDLSAGTLRYVCTLHYAPWPSYFEMAGVGFQLPLSVAHTRSVVVDCFRAAVVT